MLRRRPTAPGRAFLRRWRPRRPARHRIAPAPAPPGGRVRPRVGPERSPILPYSYPPVALPGRARPTRLTSTFRRCPHGRAGIARGEVGALPLGGRYRCRVHDPRLRPSSAPPSVPVNRPPVMTGAALRRVGRPGSGRGWVGRYGSGIHWVRASEVYHPWMTNPHWWNGGPWGPNLRCPPPPAATAGSTATSLVHRDDHP
jgi:hypothetical protein